jgi:hypothetical protein
MGVAPSQRRRSLVWIAFAAVLTATGLGVAGMRWRAAHTTLERGWSAYHESRWREALSLANQHLREDKFLGSGRHAFTPIGREDDGVLRDLRLAPIGSARSESFDTTTAAS